MRRVQRALRQGVAAMIGVSAACAHLGPQGEPTVCVTVPFEPRGPASSPEPQRLAPLGGAPFEDLAVPGYLDAVVSLPLGATAPRPLIVAVHGEGERPEQPCKLWRDVVADQAFVLCPRGFPESPTGGAGFLHPSYLALGSEIEAAIVALVARHPPHVDPSAPVLAGSGQGASLGALLLPHHPARFTRAVLVEGGRDATWEWAHGAARRFRMRGGERVLFLCGCGECATGAARAEAHLRKAGVNAQVVYFPGAADPYEGPLADEAARSFGWLTAGDARFGGGER